MIGSRTDKIQPHFFLKISYNPSRASMVTFSWGQKGCDYSSMCDYSGYDDCEVQYYVQG